MVGMFAAQAIGCLGMAVLLVVAGRRLARLTWVATAGLASAAIVGYVVVRSVPMPDLEDRIGAWLDPAGIVALTVEVLLVGVCARGIPLLGTELRERGQRSGRPRPPPPGWWEWRWPSACCPWPPRLSARLTVATGRTRAASLPRPSPTTSPAASLNRRSRRPAGRSSQRDAQRVSTAAHADGDHASFDGWVVALLAVGTAAFSVIAGVLLWRRTAPAGGPA